MDENMGWYDTPQYGDTTEWTEQQAYGVLHVNGTKVRPELVYL